MKFIWGILCHALRLQTSLKSQEVRFGIYGSIFGVIISILVMVIPVLTL